ncbi:MAG: PP2C family protein-serine/threonine phosphatase [Spirochaetales bacterium]|nr:PP2C family protein-serine/threonine phosphatase [Spirochaetales bacterium]
MTVVRTGTRETDEPSALGKIISHKSYIYRGVSSAFIHQDFLSRADLSAVAVLDRDHRFLGYLNRHSWFEKMARWQVEKGETEPTLEYLMETCPTLPHTANPLHIWDSSELEKLNREFWFSVVDGKEKFVGLFSSSDLLSYLLEISHSELDLARQVQERLNRKVLNGINSRFDVEFLSLPAKEMGGDLVYSRSLSREKSLFALFDVSGKGHASALVTGMIYGILSLAGPNTEIKRLITVINRVIYRTFHRHFFATAVVGIIDEKSSRISLADMGHSHYYLLPSRFPDALSRSGSLPLGIEEELDPEPEILEIPMTENRELLIVSDGILEQENADGQVYPIENIFALMQKNRPAPLTETINLIKKDFRRFTDHQGQHDDASFLIVRPKIP